jgi:MGT family glycosyltransferase
LLILGALIGQAPSMALREALRKTALVWLNEAVPIIESLEPDALVVEQYITVGGTIAQHLQIPFATLSTALDWRQVPAHPPGYTDWEYTDGRMARLRNRAGYRVWKWFMGPTVRAINRWRRRHGMPGLRHVDELLSCQAQIVQGCAEFDFPRDAAPWRHYGGCLACGEGRAEGDFPWERLDARPVVFASLGTLGARRNRRVLEVIAAACAKLPVQLVVSLGRWSAQDGGTTGLGRWAGDPLVVDYAPQLRLLERASLMINHGGINTVMEALSRGVPQIILPRAGDQAGTAVRALHAGVALRQPFGRPSEHKLRHAIEHVLNEDSFRERARALQQRLAETGGVAGAASFLERRLL